MGSEAQAQSIRIAKPIPGTGGEFGLTMVRRRTATPSGVLAAGGGGLCRIRAGATAPAQDLARLGYSD